MSQAIYTGAGTELEEMLKRAEDGEDVIIEREDGQRFRLVLVEASEPKRRFGSARGQVKMLEGFDNPLEEFEEYT